MKQTTLINFSSTRQPQNHQQPKMNIKQAKNFFSLGKVLAKKGELEEAIAAYQKAIKLAPDWEEVKQYLADAENKLQQQKTNDKLTMVEQLEKISATQQTDIEKVTAGETIKVDSNLAEDYHLEGDGLVQKGETEEAIIVEKKTDETKSESWEELYKQGDLLKEKEELEAAVDAYNKSIELKSDFCWSYNSLGDVLVKLKKWEEAVSAYRRTVELNPDFPWGSYKLGDVLVKLEDWDGAIAAYQKAIQLQPKLPQINIKLASALKQNQSSEEEIISCYRRAIEENPDNIELYHKLIEITPNDAELYLQLGNVLVKEGNIDEAIIFYKLGLKIQPNDSHLLSHLEKALREKLDSEKVSFQEEQNNNVQPKSADAYLSLGDDLFNQKNWQEASIAYSQAIAMNPNLVWAHYNLGRALTQHKKLDEAINVYQKIVELEPNFTEVYPTLGDILFEKKRWDEAVIIYRKAIELNVNLIWSFFNLGRALSEQKKIDEAATAYGEVIKIQPDFVEAYFALEEVLLKLNRLEEVEKLYYQVINLKLDFPKLNFKLGKVLSKQGKWEESIDLYRQVLETEPNSLEVYESLADALYASSKIDSPADKEKYQSNLEAAFNYYKEVIKSKPDRINIYHKMIAIQPYNPELYANLANVLENQGQLDGAICFYQIALDIKPQKLEYCLLLQRVIEDKNKVLNSPISARQILNKEKIIKDLILPQSQEPLVSIIIPVYNKVGYTLKCLQSLADNLNSSASVEILVVDDYSKDETQYFIEEISGVRYIKNPENMGFIRTCNYGASLSRGEYLCFLNNDTEICPDWLESMLTTIEENEDVGIVGSKLIYPNGLLQEGGGVIWNNGSGWNYGKLDNPEAPEYNYLRPIDYCSGASLLIKTETFESLGRFEKDFVPAYYEDTDLCFAVRNKLALKVMYQPRSKVIHYEGISSGTSTSSGIKRYQKINAVKFTQKWHNELQNHCQPGDPLNPIKAPRRLCGEKIILFIEHQIPCYDKESGYRRIFEIIKMFKNINYHVIFAPDKGINEEPYTSELQNMGVEVLYSNENYDVGIEEQVKRILPIVDIAWICRPELNQKYAWLVREHSSNAKIVYDTIDLHYVRLKRGWELLPDSAPEKPEKEQEWQGTQKHEIAMAKYADLTITVTEVEKNILIEQEVSNVAVVPNIHLPYQGKGESFQQREGILFIGGYKHIPNIDAVEWLCQSIMPLVWQYLPEVKVTLLGSHPPEEVQKLASDRVTVTGYVRDVTPYFLNHRVFVSPLRYGAGMKGKIGQSLEYGLPVISTKIGAEGMGLLHDYNVLIADTADDFAEEILRLCKDEQLWYCLANNSKDAIAPYTPEYVQSSLVELMRDLSELQ
ncbi:MAG: tetratricopeptide repeat protein [Cyanobacteria bacterium P01_H01_bin.35]